MKKYFLSGFEESWGAKHHRTTYYAPLFYNEEERELGATLVCSCHHPCMTIYIQGGKKMLGLRWDLRLYEVEVPPQETLKSPLIFEEGSEGYDVALCEPWDQDPREHFEKRVEYKNEIALFDHIPHPCKECDRTFTCRCVEEE
jgi:hypothetical protein